MATVIYNEFLRANAAGEIDLNADDIRVALLMTNTTADTDNDGDLFVGDLTTLDEMDGANYVRKALTSEAVNKDDANDRAEFTADAVTWTALGNGTRDVQGYLIYKHVTNDADSPLIAFIDFATDQSPGGSDFTITPDAEGILQFSQAA